MLGRRRTRAIGFAVAAFLVLLGNTPLRGAALAALWIALMIVVPRGLRLSTGGSMAASDRLEPLRQAVGGDPENTGLRLVYAEALAGAGRLAEATVEYQELFMREALPASDLVTAGRIAVTTGAYAFASSLAAEARAHGAAGAARRSSGSRSTRRSRRLAPGRSVTVGMTGGSIPATATRGRPSPTSVGWPMKGAIERLIVLPFRQPDVYRRFGRKAGGGLLLYGPPGCGKTLLARATAAECELPFLNVRIESILDPYFGVSERNLHDAFVRARASAPCVLFLDELNAIGTVRSRTRGGGAALVDQLLQELDGIGSDNDGILVLGATNVPWDVDDALEASRSARPVHLRATTRPRRP